MEIQQEIGVGRVRIGDRVHHLKVTAKGVVRVVGGIVVEVVGIMEEGVTRDAPGGIIGVVRVLGLKHSISPNKVMICVISVVYDGTLTITVTVKLVMLLVSNVG